MLCCLAVGLPSGTVSAIALPSLYVARVQYTFSEPPKLLLGVSFNHSTGKAFNPSSSSPSAPVLREEPLPVPFVRPGSPQGV